MFGCPQLFINNSPGDWWLRDKHRKHMAFEGPESFPSENHWRKWKFRGEQSWNTIRLKGKQHNSPLFYHIKYSILGLLKVVYVLNSSNFFVINLLKTVRYAGKNDLINLCAICKSCHTFCFSKQLNRRCWFLVEIRHFKSVDARFELWRTTWRDFIRNRR